MIKTIPISSIIVESRQRQDLGNLDEDFASVKELGLIQPIVVEELTGGRYSLLAGGRRLTWLTANGYTELHHGVTCDPARPGYVLSYELTPVARQEAELYENIKRKALDWKEECRAIVTVHRHHWNENKSSAMAWSQKHTAKLLGIPNGKISYAIQISDELARDPEGPIAKSENFFQAVKCLIATSEKEARKEQDTRRAASLKYENETQPSLPLSSESEPSGIEPTEKTIVWLSRMCFQQPFDLTTDDDIPISSFPCAMIFGMIPPDLAKLHRFMRDGSYVVWAHNRFRKAGLEDIRPFGCIPWPVVWNVLGHEPNSLYPFAPNQYHITILTKGTPEPPCPCPTSIVSCDNDGSPFLPVTVLEYLLRALTLSGDSVFLPNGGPAASLASISRRPFVLDQTEEAHLATVESLRAYYTELYQGEVEFK